MSKSFKNLIIFLSGLFIGGLVAFFVALYLMSQPAGGYPVQTISPADFKAISEICSNDEELSRASILRIVIINSGTVEIRTGSQTKPLQGSGKYYRMKKSTDGVWRKVKDGLWISNAKEKANKSIQGIVAYAPNPDA